ncbi:MAG: NAD(P)/FAD-dependent oxidoreductase [Chloroflexi bacterium]|nr:NAD(P)/FAD-dependent oxidoreductase [Chloroflexota bacterium]MBV9599526.1 NAD(P)/FAD-dependent oxidoreductase [Chloroflexota bacterium]
MSTQPAVVIAGAGYAGLHVALRLSTSHGWPTIRLIDRHLYHQIVTELPRVAAGLRSAEAVRVSLDEHLAKGIQYVETEVTGFDLAGHRVVTASGPVDYERLVVALGSVPNDYGIPGLTQHALNLYSSADAEHVWHAVQATVQAAAAEADLQRRARLMTILIGGAGPTGVEMAGELAEALPKLARADNVDVAFEHVTLVEAGPAILPGFSPSVVDQAGRILRDLHVTVLTGSAIAEAVDGGFKLKNGEMLSGGLIIWTGGLRAPDVITQYDFALARTGRIQVDAYLRATGHPEVFVAGDVAAVADPVTGRLLAPLAQTALSEAETVVHKGIVVSVGPSSGVAEVGGRTIHGSLVHALKDLIEWEYRASIKHPHGWSPI